MQFHSLKLFSDPATRPVFIFFEQIKNEIKRRQRYGKYPLTIILFYFNRKSVTMDIYNYYKCHRSPQWTVIISKMENDNVFSYFYRKSENKKNLKNHFVKGNINVLQDLPLMAWSWWWLQLETWHPRLCVRLGQCLPPFNGWTMTDLVLDMVPGPQSTSQDDQGPHSLTSQSMTETNRS